MKKRKLIKRQIELLSISLEQFKNGAPFTAISSFSSAYLDCFYRDNTMLKDEFVESVPASFLANARDLLDFLRAVSGKTGDTYISSYRNITLKKDSVVSLIETLLKYLNEEVKDISSNIVFYSWQSDLPSKTNHSFIEGCIEAAIKIINKNSESELILDSDTKNIPGSPDIVTTILDKIDDSSIFVGDVSLLEKLSGSNKLQCNQNVMFETGYALKSLSYERVVLVCNTINGELKELPFDLGLKRIIDYKLSRDDTPESKKIIKEKLIGELAIAFKSILRRLDE